MIPKAMHVITQSLTTINRFRIQYGPWLVVSFQEQMFIQFHYVLTIQPRVQP
jgi:hypothetical protein